MLKKIALHKKKKYKKLINDKISPPAGTISPVGFVGHSIVAKLTD